MFWIYSAYPVIGDGIVGRLVGHRSEFYILRLVRCWQNVASSRWRSRLTTADADANLLLRSNRVRSRGVEKRKVLTCIQVQTRRNSSPLLSDDRLKLCVVRVYVSTATLPRSILWLHSEQSMLGTFGAYGVVIS